MAAVAPKVGVFGGAFDPPHLGHVALARAGIEHFALDRLLVRVVEDPGHKEVSTPPATRLRLAELAFEPLLGVAVELDPFARTVDSLEALALPDPVFLRRRRRVRVVPELEGARARARARAARGRDPPGRRPRAPRGGPRPLSTGRIA